MRPLLPLTGILVGAIVSLHGVELTLDRRAIEQALVLAASPFDEERSAFHRPYRLEVSQPPVDYIEIVTPYRRVVLAAQAAARGTGRTISQREATEALGELPSQIDVVVELTFHPMNTFVGVPDYSVTLVPEPGSQARRGVLEPLTLFRAPRHGPRVERDDPRIPAVPSTSLLSNSEPLLGGSLLAEFDGDQLEANVLYAVVIAEQATEIVRVRADFSRLR